MSYPEPLQKLIGLFSKLPGIGPRQATRFAFFILKNNYAPEISLALEGLNKIGFCNQCFKTKPSENPLCSICEDARREITKLAVVEKESELQSLEKTGEYKGLYHVLGGVISPLDEDSARNLHLRELYQRIKNTLDKNQKCEVILATNPTTEGDTTALYIERVLEPLKKHYAGFKISRLGRGLSLGSELEHVDEITLKNALTNRK